MAASISSSKPLMKLTPSVDYRAHYSNKNNNNKSSTSRTLKQKKQVRSSILASLDRQIWGLDASDKSSEVEETHLVPFDSVVSNSILLQQQSHRFYDDDDEQQEQEQQPRISDRTSRILASLDKHIPPPPPEIIKELPTIAASPSTTSSTPKSPKRKASKRTSSNSSSKKKKSPQVSLKKSPSSSSSSKKSLLEDASSSSSSSKNISLAGGSTTKKKKTKRRSSSLDSSSFKTSMDVSSKTRSSSLSRPSTHSSVSSTAPLHLMPSSYKDDGSSVSRVLNGDDDDDVIIANLVPMSAPSFGQEEEEEVEEGSQVVMTPKSLKKKKKKKDGSLTPKKKKKKKKQPQRLSMKSSSDSSTWDKSTMNTNSTSLTIEEASNEEDPSTSNHHLVYWSKNHNNQDVAIGNLMPIGKSAPPSPPQSPEPAEKRISDSSFDSEEQFEHFYAEPAKRSSIVNTTTDGRNSIVSQVTHDDDIEDDEEEELEEHEEINMDLMEASMSLSDIFHNLRDTNTSSSGDVMIGNITPMAPPTNKKEITVSPIAEEIMMEHKSPKSNTKSKRWSLRGQRTIDAEVVSTDNRGSLRGSIRSIRTIESFFSRGQQQPQQQQDENSENSQDLASEQRLAAIFGANSPFVSEPTSPVAAPQSFTTKQSNRRIEEWLEDVPRTPVQDDDEYVDQDEKSRDRIREIFGPDHELAVASPQPTSRKQQQERRGSVGSTRSGRSTDSKKSPFGSLHSRFTNRSGRSKERSIDNNSSGNSLFSARSGLSRERSLDGQPQERRGSLGSLKSHLSIGSSSVKKPRKDKSRSRSPLRRAFSHGSNKKTSKSPPPPPMRRESSGIRPLDDDELIVIGVLKRYDRTQCRSFEDHQEMAEAELISSMTNTSPAELRRLKNKLAERLRAQFFNKASSKDNNNQEYHNSEDESVNDSDHLIEVYDDTSDVTSLTSMTSFTNFGGGSVRSGYTKSSRTLDRPSNSTLNYQHINDEERELVFVKQVAMYGGKYSGTIDPVTSQPHGKGRMVYRGSKGIYTGEWKQGQWNGKGKHIKGNGDYYEGHFMDNLYHGNGVFSYKQSGRFFEGQYVMGERTKGTMRYADGSVYKGQFYHGRRHGRGSYTFKDGSRYKGDFYKDLMQGIGELRFRDGSSYVGEWKKGKHEGQGSMYSPDGMLCWAGMWRDGQQVLE